MIRHTAVFRLKHDAGSPAEADFLTAIRKLKPIPGVEKFEVDLRRTDFRLAGSPLKIAGVVFISAQPARRGVLLTPLRRTESLARFKKSQSYAVTQPGWTTFRKRIAGTPAFELRRGRSPAEAAHALQALLADGDAAGH